MIGHLLALSSLCSSHTLIQLPHPDCEPGYEGVSGKCTLCPAGRAGRGGICESCKRGFYAAHAGMSECLPCEAGRVSSSGDTQCVLCPSGTFTEKGYVLFRFGVGGDRVLMEGFFVFCRSVCVLFPCSWRSDRLFFPLPTNDSAFGSVICSMCQIGTYSHVGSTKCAPCPTGTFNSLQGKAGCVMCGAGFYNPNLGSVSKAACKVCPAGFACPAEDSEKPISCEDGFISSGGLAACEECPSLFQTSDFITCSPHPTFYLFLLVLFAALAGCGNCLLSCPKREWGAITDEYDPVL